MVEIDWAERWKRIVEDRETLASGHADTGYWDRRSSSYARSTQSRVDDFLKVLEPFLSPRKTLIDVGAGAGRHAVPLAEKLEWVTAVEPSEGKRAHLPALPNLTVVASALSSCCAKVRSPTQPMCCATASRPHRFRRSRSSPTFSCCCCSSASPPM